MAGYRYWPWLLSRSLKLSRVIRSGFAGLVLTASLGAGLTLPIASAHAQQPPVSGRDSSPLRQEGSPQFLPPVHLFPGQAGTATAPAAPRPATAAPRPAAAAPQPVTADARRSYRQLNAGRNDAPTRFATAAADGSGVGQIEASESGPSSNSILLVANHEGIDSPFQQLEQDLSMPQVAPPVERISQTPADPATRPHANSPASDLPTSSSSVLGSRDTLRLPGEPAAEPTGLPVTSGQSRVPAWNASSNQPWSAASENLPRNLPGNLPGNPTPGGFSPESIWQDEPAGDATGNAAQDSDPDDPKRKPAEKDCGEFRTKLLANPITSVALDISPPQNSRGSGPRQFQRDWTDIHGNLIASGTMVELRRGYVIIDTINGRQKIAFARLGEADLAAISEAWELPTHCLSSTDVFNGRCWEPMTVTWHAANLCHKPLYFEDVALERYGHSDGPFMQPVRSTAHFFVSLITLPYQTGIHPPNECQYALGYYRPGSCAPWIVYPVPLSPRGTVHQAGFILGAAYTLF